MICIKKRSILPQVGGFTWGRLPVLPVLALVSLGLSGCASVKIESDKPSQPQTVEQAREYLRQKPALMQQLTYELNVAERDCYDRFMVSDCVDSVRACSAEYRRAHIEAEAVANDLIRQERLGKRTKP